VRKDILDPMDGFVAKVRAVGTSAHAIVGPVCYADAERKPTWRLIEVVVAARQPTREQPFTALAWHFEIPKPPNWEIERKKRELLTYSLLKHFNNIEDCRDQHDLARVVEKYWPSKWTTAVREYFEADQRRRQAYDELRLAYIDNRKGAKDARGEFFKIMPVRPNEARSHLFGEPLTEEGSVWSRFQPG
jgi:hypothetical protein